MLLQWYPNDYGRGLCYIHVIFTSIFHCESCPFAIPRSIVCDGTPPSVIPLVAPALLSGATRNIAVASPFVKPFAEIVARTLWA